ncbi:ribosomal protein S18 acetylase RimI-like enzyme [Saccharothrix australiensis]|uniref:Ribosomal protein S18 acetylase RimI-like enzyme n=1 Tax=Saccharothrix australiensis TaxID=2072 RepID=A0A495W287_9PSEU|nr:ribosomal protein S18 acetylase RimI-like enzyme [Saccharothrix australiensis]
MTTWTVRAVDPEGTEAQTLIRTYLADIIERYYGRPATADEVAGAIADDPTDDLSAFFVGSVDGRPLGCAGFRMVTGETAELKRLFVHSAARGLGGGAALLAAVEEAAVSIGATTVRLDTRADLVEARRLYARHGYREVAPFNCDRYADHWFQKRL